LIASFVVKEKVEKEHQSPVKAGILRSESVQKANVSLNSRNIAIWVCAEGQCESK